MEVLTKALDGADVVVTTGGVSMGEKVRQNNRLFTKASTGLIKTCIGN